jgi:sulfur-oxidizing protein SoxA
MKRILFASALLAAVALPAIAAQPMTDSEKAIAEYREMLSIGNPADLWIAKGEELWATKRGPKHASMQACDLGKGPGVVKGAFVELPRYFADTDRVQDLESRLLTCMQTLQGLDAKEIAKTPYGKGEKKNMESLVAWISSESRGMDMNLPQSHPQERTMYELGKRAFFYRAGPYDFACATCHGVPDQRIRLQGLPVLTGNPGDGVGFAAWPAYRVGNSQLWGMQKRLNDCYRQQRFPEPGYASDVTIALGVYLGVNAKGAESIAPSIKR